MPIYRLNFKSGGAIKYETESGKFYLDDMSPIHFDIGEGVDELRSFKHEPYEKGALIHKSRTPRKVRIVMGFECNYKCKYCSQQLTRDSHPESVLKKADSFLEVFLKTIKNPRSIEFWGGEPLVYWKTLQKIVPPLREAYPTTTFRIITNGSLVTREIVDFLIKYKFVVSVSHDADGQHIRGEDPLKDPKKKALLIDLYEGLKDSPHSKDETTFGFAAVMTKENCDPKAIGAYFRKNFHPKVSVSVSYCTAMGGVGGNDNFLSVAFDKESLKSMGQNVYRALVELDDLAANTIIRDARDTITKLVRNETSEQIGSRCETDSSNHLIVKLNGDVLQCQNTDAHGEYGNIRDYDNIAVSGFKQWDHRPTCPKCPLVHLCFGACPAIKGNDFVDSCNVNWEYYMALFKFAVLQIFGDELVSIEGEIYRPERELIETSHGKVIKLARVDV